MSDRRVILVMREGEMVGIYSSLVVLCRSKVLKRSMDTLYKRVVDGKWVEIGGFRVYRGWVNY